MGNIFDEFSKSEIMRKKNKQKRNDKNKPRQLHPSPLTTPAPIPSSKQEEMRLQSYEINRIFKQMDEMQSDLDEKLSDIIAQAERAGVDPNAAMRILGPTYAPEIQIIRTVAGIEEKKGDLEEPPMTTPLRKQPQTSEEILTKQRRGKLRGARQKWLPMQ